MYSILNRPNSVIGLTFYSTYSDGMCKLFNRTKASLSHQWIPLIELTDNVGLCYHVYVLDVLSIPAYKSIILYEIYKIKSCYVKQRENTG